MDGKQRLIIMVKLTGSCYVETIYEQTGVQDRNITDFTDYTDEELKHSIRCYLADFADAVYDTGDPADPGDPVSLKDIWDAWDDLGAPLQNAIAEIKARR